MEGLLPTSYRQRTEFLTHESWTISERAVIARTPGTQTATDAVGYADANKLRTYGDLRISAHALFILARRPRHKTRLNHYATCSAALGTDRARLASASSRRIF